MHRFVWDLHYPPPDALEHEYPISAIYRDTPRYPLGPEVLPGKYTARLTVNGKVFTQALMIKIDPRVKTPQEGLRQQFELETRIAEAMHQDYAALLEVRRVLSCGNLRRKRSVGVVIATHAVGQLWSEQMNIRVGYLWIELPQRCDVVKNPKRATVRSHDNIISVHNQVTHGRRWQIKSQ